MGLFSQSQLDQINAVAAKSKEALKPAPVSKSVTSMQHTLEESTRDVLEYFKDSPAILIHNQAELHEYVDKVIASGYCAIDTETTGLDRIHDTIVGASLYYPGGVECYIPCRHIVPIMETPYKGQLSYEEVGSELQRLVDAEVKTIWYNADFDIAMIYKDFKVDFIPVCYYDCMIAWRCLKENDDAHGLKALYAKYVSHADVKSKKFSDFFSPKLYPYSKPDVAKLYAANDAKITFELFKWQLPYITKGHPKCQKHHLERIADLVWNIEFPMVKTCAKLHRVGVYYDMGVRNILKVRYDEKYSEANAKLVEMIQEIINNAEFNIVNKSPFRTGRDFNEGSPKHVLYLLNGFLQLDVASGDKETLTNLNLPITEQILKVRALGKLLNSFIDSLPGNVGPDGRIHASFNSIGADTGRCSSSDPNMQQIPSHALDIRHEFRATPAMEKTDACEEVDGAYQITLGSYDSVTVDRGDEHWEQVDVVDLKIGDCIIAKDRSLTITDIITNLPNTTLVFDVTDSNEHIDIPHITPAYVMMSSDFSQQEPKMLAYKSGDRSMIDAFKQGRDIYSTIAALSFNRTYEECSEFFFDENGNKTDQVNREGKERRSSAKSIVLGITYGRSTKTIGDQLFGKNENMTEQERTAGAQGIYDAVLNAFPNLNSFIQKCQSDARKYGYVETILGRRRHIPDMQLKPYEFRAMKSYVNPDIDPLDPKTLKNKSEIPERIVKQLEKEFAGYKHKGQVYRRIKELGEFDHIRVIDNSKLIRKATRKCCNSVIQGSAADLTKIAMLKVDNNPEWQALGAVVLLQVHDELIAEAPIRNAKRAGELLGQLMSEAGSFLPFTISCDVATTYKWYGLDYPCPYTRPELSEDTVIGELTPDEIKWIQYHLFECEYTLPVYKDKDGKKPMGDAASGINGIWSEESAAAMTDYMQKYNLDITQFVDNIFHRVNGDVIK